MTTLVLDYSRDEARTLVKAAFEMVGSIETYFDDGIRVTGRTGGSFVSYGEVIRVEIPEQQSDDDRTMISVIAEREVAMNITSRPEAYKSQFIQSLETFRGHEIEHVLEVLLDEIGVQTKEVYSLEQQASGTTLAGWVMIALVVFGSLVALAAFPLFFLFAVVPLAVLGYYFVVAT
ncbi:hypothetical protein SAMN04487967_0661 [Natronorubrum sediminis]|uniref:Uncharacterized protein n=1 Tax=Natronorubrum sediminis TaxID=640943 RepID=A0A1H6FMJ0_9EURY|nr:hypothetical protein [Natronorubrum sediminis]SEH12117.1 hypothetical protein SAMN04487967_0661 [Natronorubrum sediminis]